jgi:hypothetical protein
MKYSASQAATATGKAIPTITRAIKSGKISAERTDSGGYLIDPAELHRVFPPVTRKGDETPPMLGHETSNESGVLEAELKVLRERLTDKDDVIADLRKRLDQEGEERRRLTAMITDQRAFPAYTEAVEPPRRRWWSFGRAND